MCSYEIVEYSVHRNCIATPSAISYSHHLLPKLTPLGSDAFGQGHGLLGGER
jgi:hypothetical protein